MRRGLNSLLVDKVVLLSQKNEHTTDKQIEKIKTTLRTLVDSLQHYFNNFDDKTKLLLKQ